MSDLYQTKEWKSLPAKERYCLLPTMEDVRPGGLISIPKHNTRDLEYCLNGKNLKYHKKSNLWLFSKNKTLLKEAARKWEDDFAPGKFFGYPDCCVEHFAKEDLRNVLAGREWEKKAGKALLEGIYNPLLDYTLHVPCSISCKESLKIGRKIKKCLKAYDKEVAECLRIFNRSHAEAAANKLTTTKDELIDSHEFVDLISRAIRKCTTT